MSDQAKMLTDLAVVFAMRTVEATVAGEQLVAERWRGCMEGVIESAAALGLKLTPPEETTPSQPQTPTPKQSED